MGITRITFINSFYPKFCFFKSSKHNLKESKYNKIDGKIVYLTIIFIIFTVIMGGRDLSVGVDTAPYSRTHKLIFETDSLIEALSLNRISAPVYVILCKIIGLVTTNSQIMIICIAIAINYGICKYIYDTADDVVLATFCWYGLGLFFFSMNGSRQSLSMIIAANSLKYIEKDFFSPKGWIMFLLAIGIHYTAIFLLIGIVISFLTKKIRYNINVLLVTLGISAAFSFFYSLGIKLIIYFVPRYSIYVDGSSPYSIYKNTGNGRIIVLYLFLLCICLIGFIKNKSTYKKDDDFQIQRNYSKKICQTNDKDNKKNNQEKDSYNFRIFPIIFFGTILGIIYSKNELINRLIWYYVILYISYIPYALKRFPPKLRIISKILVIVILCVYSVVSLNEGKNGIVPYRFFL